MTVHNDTVVGYKVFDNEFTSKGYHFKGVGVVNEYDKESVPCESCFNFCINLEDCFKYNPITSDMVICEVTASNYSDHKQGCSRRNCNTLTITKRMSPDEVATHINDGFFAYQWALHVGNRDIMITRMNSLSYACFWVGTFGNRDILLPKFPDLANFSGFDNVP